MKQYKIPKLFTHGAVVIVTSLMLALAQQRLLEAALMFLIVPLTFLLGYGSCAMDVKRFNLSNDSNGGKGA